VSNRAPIALGLWLCACTGVDGPHTGETDVDDSDQPEGFSVSGAVVDLDGEPVENLFVTVSTEFCIPDRTDPEGSFTVASVSPGPKRLITYGETVEGGTYASVVFPFEAEAAVELASPVLAPVMALVPFDPEVVGLQSIHTADGLRLDVEPTSITFAPFADPVVLAARVPVADAPPFVPDGLNLVDLFVLHPIQSTIAPSASIAFPADTGLSPGTAVNFHTLDYETGLLTLAASGSVNADGVPESAPGQGISELTWVALSVAES